MLIARAYAEAGETEKAWRVVEWLRGIHGGLSGGWFERYGQSITPPMPPVGVLGWTWYEMIALYVYHFAGFRPETDRIVFTPSLPAKLPQIVLTQTVREARLEVAIRRATKAPRALVDGKEVPFRGGRMEVGYPPAGSVSEMLLEV
jgi:cellobiose phosphorylase